MEQPPQFPEIAKNNVEQIFPGETKETRKLRKELEQQNIVFRLLSPRRSTVEVMENGKPFTFNISSPDFETLGIFWKNESGNWEEIARGNDPENINGLVRDIYESWPGVQRGEERNTTPNEPEDLRSAA